MYENGQIVDQMRVVAGRPDPNAPTPMMSAYIRYAALNPYWNSPADITAKRLAPTILKEGRLFQEQGLRTLVRLVRPPAHPRSDVDRLASRPGRSSAGSPAPKAGTGRIRWAK